MASIISLLKADHLITVTVGDEESEEITFRLQKAILLDLSDSGVFSAILQDTTTYNVTSHQLVLPDDQPYAWEVLLDWKIRGSLPDATGWRPGFAIWVFIQCWLLGEKYDIPKFQDLVMLELLYHTNVGSPDTETMRLAFRSTKPRSKLCELMAEEAARELHRTRSENLVRLLELCEGSKDFMPLILRASIKIDGSIASGRFDESEGWRKYMVADGPKKLWVFDEKKDDEAEV